MQKCIHSKQSAKFIIPNRFAPYRDLKGSMQYENINFTFFRYTVGSPYLSEISSVPYPSVP